MFEQTESEGGAVGDATSIKQKKKTFPPFRGLVTDFQPVFSRLVIFISFLCEQVNVGLFLDSHL